MSNYQIGAFEALEWAWHLLRSYKGKRKGVDEARYLIKKILSNMGEGVAMDFSQKTSEIRVKN